MKTVLSKILFILIWFISFSGCKNEDIWKSELFSSVDSVQVKPYLYRVSDTTKTEFQVTVSDSISIKEIENAISSKESPAYVCGYTGSINIFRNDSIILSASYNHKCNTILFYTGKRSGRVIRRITKDGLDLFKAYADRISDSLNGEYVRGEKL